MKTNSKNRETLKFKKVKKFVKFLETLETMPTGYNRPTTDQHIKDLTLSILEIGVERMINVVKTDIFGKKGGLYTLDAQHLVKAILSLSKEQLENLEGHFIVGITEMDNIDEMIRKMGILNSVQKVFGLDKFLTSWTAVGKEEYIFLRDFMLDNKLPLNGVIECFNGKLSKGNLEFKQGTFKAKREQGLKVHELYKKLIALGFNHYRGSLFNALVRFTIQNPDIKHSDIYKRVERVADFKQFKSRDIYIGALEYHCKKK